MFSSRLRLSGGVIVLHPASLPRGLRVILTPVIYEAAALHSAESSAAALRYTTVLLVLLRVDGRSTSEGHAGGQHFAPTINS